MSRPPSGRSLPPAGRPYESRSLLEGGHSKPVQPLLVDDRAAQCNERAAREGFSQGRVVWFGCRGEWKADWYFFIDNSHTLVSPCRGHVLHPFDRFDRGCYALCVICLNLFLSAYVQHKRKVATDAMTEEQDLRVNAAYYGRMLAASTILVAYDLVLRLLATSPCVRSGGSLYGVCFLCRDCCVDCGRQGLYACLAASGVLALAGLVVALQTSLKPSAFLETFVLMKTLSYGTEFIPLAYQFYSKREAQREYWDLAPARLESEPTGGAYPLGRSWPETGYIRAKVSLEKESDAVKRPSSTAAARESRAQARRAQAQRLARPRDSPQREATREQPRGVQMQPSRAYFEDADEDNIFRDDSEIHREDAFR
ncbi:hypothetical protein M885DRAFT_463673 [Pelagophyceae sp. CCMP2097]|nr:hypothetical protein M885DRAFT_463673 [Pelagophyceae sp. CCMP2097]|mmetsp:Transcript_15334/g.51595  ORF Transcript_15334/g.51595 Transcript_15334/m.51595 type:complete len:368 (-) Transcript_15334:41-1144(-)